MYQSKLLNEIRCLSEEELKQFLLFLQSPYFNRNAKAIKLFEIIYSCAPHYDAPKLHRAKVFPVLFPLTPIVGTNLNQLMSELLKLLRKFLAVQNYFQNPLEERIALLSELLNRNQTDSLKQVLQQEPLELLQNENTFYYQYKLAQIVFGWDMRTQNRQIKEHLTELLDAADSYLMTIKIRLMVGALSRQGVLDRNYELRFENIIEQYVHQEAFQQNALLQLYYCMFTMLKNPDNTTQYYEFRRLLQIHNQTISTGEKMQFYGLCLNQELKFLKTKVKITHQDVFELLKEMVESNMFQQHMPIVYYTHIVKAATEVSQFDWAAEFMKKYSPKIVCPKIEDKQATQQYALALWHFKQQQYKKAKQVLGIKYADALYYLERKTILLKILYQLARQEFMYSNKAAEEFEAEIKAMKTYLDRDKQLAKFNKEAISKFVKYQQTLFLLQNKVLINQPKVPKQIKDKLILLRTKTEQTQALYENAWLLQSIDQLIALIK